MMRTTLKHHYNVKHDGSSLKHMCEYTCVSTCLWTWVYANTSLSVSWWLLSESGCSTRLNRTQVMQTFFPPTSSSDLLQTRRLGTAPVVGAGTVNSSGCLLVGGGGCHCEADASPLLYQAIFCLPWSDSSMTELYHISSGPINTLEQSQHAEIIVLTVSLPVSATVSIWCWWQI